MPESPEIKYTITVYLTGGINLKYQGCWNVTYDQGRCGFNNSDGKRICLLLGHGFIEICEE